ncbi:MAG: GNAT family N-acetyltransferase [Pirellulaceae bacterium]|nr:GNAT family N-acetyltransferase [Pirellulaceae bacterium]
MTAPSFSAVDPDQWREFVSWVDPMKSPSDVDAVLAEYARRQALHPQCPPPMEARVGDQRVAGAYMMLLGARVAALAGVRAVDNYTPTAARLLSELVSQVRAQGASQIQAILDGTESVAEDIVEQAGFVALAELQQLVLPLPINRGQNGTLDPAPLPTGLKWIAARDVTRAKMVQLLAHTFIETLDCPALNGLRTPEDVLEGFLDGQELSQQGSWWILAGEDKYIGCSLVNQLPNNTAELVYMGLGPTSRGRGYGKFLLEQGVRSALQLRAQMFLAAVDCANWPATRLYFQAGFQQHARVQAWFHLK